MTGHAEPVASSLTDDEFVLSLIATGVVQLYEQVADGFGVVYPYPSPLQRGLDRLVALKLQREETPPQGVPDLLAWCQQPLASWGLNLVEDAVGLNDRLLDGQVPTNVCEGWAYASHDVEAELSERQFMKSVFEASQTSGGPELYTAFRKLMITSPVLNGFEFQMCQISPELQALGEQLKTAYRPAPSSHIVDHHFVCCANCGNLLVRTDRHELVCENERCRIAGAGVGRRIPEREQAYWLTRWLRRFVAAPGLAEVRLAEAIESPGLTVELWPLYDRYDIRITFPDGESWAIDVKDWANPFLLAKHVEPIPDIPPWTKAFFVFPDERLNQRRDYLRAFRNHCGILAQNMEAVWASQLLRELNRKLERVTNA